MITVTDKDYLPLPVENRDLEFLALDLAYRAMKCREHGAWQAASMYEAKLGKVAQKAEGGSREQIEKVQETLRKDMARRLRDAKPQLRVVI
jgi:hypothetical protein